MPHIDVAIIGGGPAGSTAGTFLRKYGNDLKVLILERETFPRDHVGESQVPTASAILDEMGVWDKVEAADFPIKVGATYKWGKTSELWDFDFVPMSIFDKDLPRPGRFEGQRTNLAFQVERATYDKILLDHAQETGCEVREATRVVRIDREGDRVTGLQLEGGETVTARWYLDASGHAGVLRRAMDVRTESPTRLQNIAIWDYWRNAQWAETLGIGGTRVQVISVHNGWIWFIPIGPDRTSVGLIVPASYYKAQGRAPADLYAEALKEDARLAGFMEGATSEGKLQTTKDWSFLSERHSGENWFLAGEASGFADPILAAGMTISHASAREAAFTILDLDRGGDEAWLKAAYDEKQTSRILNHIRFADFWYSANAQFTDLRDYTSEIARMNGLDLSPEKAWAWLAQGGFIDDDARTGTGGHPLPIIKQLSGYLNDLRPTAILYRCNRFRLDLEGAERIARPHYRLGRVGKTEAYVRGGHTLPIQPPFDFWFEALREPGDSVGLQRRMAAHHATLRPQDGPGLDLLAALEAMIEDGWVVAEFDRSIPRMMTQAQHAMVNPH